MYVVLKHDIANFMAVGMPLELCKLLELQFPKMIQDFINVNVVEIRRRKDFKKCLSFYDSMEYVKVINASLNLYLFSVNRP